MTTATLASAIAGGRLDTRLETTGDPDLTDGDLAAPLTPLAALAHPHHLLADGIGEPDGSLGVGRQLLADSLDRRVYQIAHVGYAQISDVTDLAVTQPVLEFQPDHLLLARRQRFQQSQDVARRFALLGQRVLIVTGCQLQQGVTLCNRLPRLNWALGNLPGQLEMQCRLARRLQPAADGLGRQQIMQADQGHLNRGHDGFLQHGIAARRGQDKQDDQPDKGGNDAYSST